MIINTKKGGSAPVIEPLSVTENGTYTAPSGVNGYSPVEVNTPTQIDALLYTSVCPQFAHRYPSTTPVIYCPLIDDFNRLFYSNWQGSAHNYTDVTVKSDKKVKSILNICVSETGTNQLKTLTLDMDLSECTNYATWFRNNPYLAEIKGTPWDFTKVNSAQTMFYQNVATNVPDGLKMAFKENSIHVNLSFGAVANLTNDALVSIANGLRAGANTVTFSSTPKSKLAIIKGNVSQITEGDVTYDFFTADDAGDTTLQDFITTTKGWTIA